MCWEGVDGQQGIISPPLPNSPSARGSMRVEDSGFHELPFGQRTLLWLHKVPAPQRERAVCEESGVGSREVRQKTFQVLGTKRGIHERDTQLGSLVRLILNHSTNRHRGRIMFMSMLPHILSGVPLLVSVNAGRLQTVGGL